MGSMSTLVAVTQMKYPAVLLVQTAIIAHALTLSTVELIVKSMKKVKITHGI